MYGPLAKCLRVGYRLIHPRWRIDRQQLPAAGSVLIVHHQNMFGPVHLIGLMPLEAHMWSLHCFLDRASCFDQFYHYTFCARYGWAKWLAYPAAKVLSWIVPGVLHSLQCIPVYHQASDLTTMRTSQAALMRGEYVAICPDIDYSDTSGALGEMYTGFLLLGSMHHHRTGNALPFVPAYVSRNTRRIVFGEPVTLDSSLPFGAAREKAENQLRDGINALGRAMGDILPSEENPPARNAHAEGKTAG